MTRLTSLALVLGLALVAVACGEDQAAPTLQGIVREPPLEVGDVSLPSTASGAPVAMQAADGELLLVYFGYTSCPDVCPTTTSDIRLALQEAPADVADRVTVAMTTVDPERDSPEVLTEYLGHFFDDGIGLRTDDPDELQAAADAFGVQFAVEDHAPGEAYDVSHSAVTYVVDDACTVVDEFPFGLDADAIASDLTTLLQEDLP